MLSIALASGHCCLSCQSISRILLALNTYQPISLSKLFNHSLSEIFLTGAEMSNDHAFAEMSPVSRMRYMRQRQEQIQFSMAARAWIISISSALFFAHCRTLSVFANGWSTAYCLPTILFGYFYLRATFTDERIPRLINPRDGFWIGLTFMLGYTSMALTDNWLPPVREPVRTAFIVHCVLSKMAIEVLFALRYGISGVYVLAPIPVMSEPWTFDATIPNSLHEAAFVLALVQAFVVPSYMLVAALSNQFFLDVSLLPLRSEQGCEKSTYLRISEGIVCLSIAHYLIQLTVLLLTAFVWTWETLLALRRKRQLAPMEIV